MKIEKKRLTTTIFSLFHVITIQSLQFIHSALQILVIDLIEPL